MLVDNDAKGAVAATFGVISGALGILMGEWPLAFGWHEVLKLMVGLVGRRGPLQWWHSVVKA